MEVDVEYKLYKIQEMTKYLYFCGVTGTIPENRIELLQEAMGALERETIKLKEERTNEDDET